MNRHTRIKALMARRLGAEPPAQSSVPSVDPMHRRGLASVDWYINRALTLGWGSRRFRQCEQCGTLRWEESCRCWRDRRPSSSLGCTLNVVPADYIPIERYRTPQVNPPRKPWEASRFTDLKSAEAQALDAAVDAAAARLGAARIAKSSAAPTQCGRSDRCTNPLEPGKRAGQWCEPCKEVAAVERKATAARRHTSLKAWEARQQRAEVRRIDALLDRKVACQCVLLSTDGLVVWSSPVCPTPRCARDTRSDAPAALRKKYTQWSVRRVVVPDWHGIDAHNAIAQTAKTESRHP